MKINFRRLDRSIANWMEHWGHFLHRWGLGLFFIWLGVLKVLGYKSATTLIAHAVYFADPATTIPMLGAWEAAIGVCLCWRPLIRVALLLLIIRLPGTALALVLHPAECFAEGILVPTPTGQYLIKDIILFSAAMVIGGTVREETAPLEPHTMVIRREVVMADAGKDADAATEPPAGDA